MYQIAICDDEKAELDKTERVLNNYEKRRSGLNFMVERFENADEMIYMVREKEYTPDLVFMDIYMRGKQGIEVAKELRNMGNKGKIIFLTASKEHALEAFDVDAAQYLVKPISEGKMFSVLDRFMEDVETERKKYLLLRIEGRFSRVALNDIVYCEAQGKTQCLNLVNGMQHLLRMTMAEIYDQLSCYQEFVRVGIAYIVNLEYIDSLNAQDICLNTGKKIHLPRGTYKSLKEKYFRHYCGEE